jgi:hypothetical protein
MATSAFERKPDVLKVLAPTDYPQFQHWATNASMAHLSLGSLTQSLFGSLVEAHLVTHTCKLLGCFHFSTFDMLWASFFDLILHTNPCALDGSWIVPHIWESADTCCCVAKYSLSAQTHCSLVACQKVVSKDLNHSTSGMNACCFCNYQVGNMIMQWKRRPHQSL